VKSLISTKVLSFTNYQNHHRLNFNQYTSHCDEYSFIYGTKIQFTNRSLSVYPYIFVIKINLIYFRLQNLMIFLCDRKDAHIVLLHFGCVNECQIFIFIYTDTSLSNFQGQTNAQCHMHFVKREIVKVLFFSIKKFKVASPCVYMRITFFLIQY